MEDQVGWPVPIQVLNAWEQGYCEPPRQVLRAIVDQAFANRIATETKLRIVERELYDAIRRAHASGYSFQWIANVTGLSEERVAKIVREMQGNDE